MMANIDLLTYLLKSSWSIKIDKYKIMNSAESVLGQILTAVVHMTLLVIQFEGLSTDMAFFWTVQELQIYNKRTSLSRLMM